MSAGPVGWHMHKYYKTCSWLKRWMKSGSPLCPSQSMHWLWPKCLPSALINKPVGWNTRICLHVCPWSWVCHCWGFLANVLTCCKDLFMDAPTDNWFRLFSLLAWNAMNAAANFKYSLISKSFFNCAQHMKLILPWNLNYLLRNGVNWLVVPICELLTAITDSWNCF